MDCLFTKLFTCDFINIDVNDETQREELKSDIRQAFANCDELTNYDINHLEFLFYNEEMFYFTYPNSTSIILYNGFDETWHLQLRHELKVGTQSTLQDVELLPNSSPNIEYVLYPYEQCCDLPMQFILVTPETFLDLDGLTEVTVNDWELHKTIFWNDRFIVFINSYNNQYELRQCLLNGEFVSGFVDMQSHFQIGDCVTSAYKDKDNNLIIYNQGDVSSIVCIKCN